jgi:hypothetical protein
MQDNLEVLQRIAIQSQLENETLKTIAIQSQKDSKEVKSLTFIATMYLPASLLAVSSPALIIGTLLRCYFRLYLALILSDSRQSLHKIWLSSTSYWPLNFRFIVCWHWASLPALWF